jgi:hypothetical protein
MATAVTVDADDLAYLAELAAKYLTGLGWLAGDNAALDPIFRAFLTLEEQALHTFAHQYDLWAVAGIDEMGDAW